jgi:hypothetical protein
MLSRHVMASSRGDIETNTNPTFPVMHNLKLMNSLCASYEKPNFDSDIQDGDRV